MTIGHNAGLAAPEPLSPSNYWTRVSVTDISGGMGLPIPTGTPPRVCDSKEPHTVVHRLQILP
jgi:hypothetical protein